MLFALIAISFAVPMRVDEAVVRRAKILERILRMRGEKSTQNIRDEDIAAAEANFHHPWPPRPRKNMDSESNIQVVDIIYRSKPRRVTIRTNDADIDDDSEQKSESNFIHLWPWPRKNEMNTGDHIQKKAKSSDANEQLAKIESRPKTRRQIMTSDDDSLLELPFDDNYPRIRPTKFISERRGLISSLRKKTTD